MRTFHDETREMYVFDTMTEVIEATDGDWVQIRPAYTQAKKMGLVQNSFSEIVDQTRSDWEEGLNTLQRYVDELSQEDFSEIKSRTRQVRYNEWEGDEIDYDRLRSGQDFWRSSVREESQGPTTVTVITDLSTPWDRDADQILWRGAAAIALVKLLEEKGYQVEMWAVNGSQIYNDGTRLGLGVCLKQCSDPLDVSTLVNTVSAWFYRTVNFAVRKTLATKTGKSWNLSLGSVFSWSEEELDLITTDERRVYSSGVFSFRGALDLIRAELEDINNKEND